MVFLALFLQLWTKTSSLRNERTRAAGSSPLRATKTRARLVSNLLLSLFAFLCFVQIVNRYWANISGLILGECYSATSFIFRVWFV